MKIVLQVLINNTIPSNGKAINADNRNNTGSNFYVQFKQNALETSHVNVFTPSKIGLQHDLASRSGSIGGSNKNNPTIKATKARKTSNASKN